MKTYEITYLITPNLTEEEAREFQEKVASFVKEEGGVLVTLPTSISGGILKRKLAYPIKKQIQAHLSILIFQLDQKKLANLEKKLKSESQILRYLLLTKPRPKEIKVLKRRFVPERVSPRPKEKKVKVELKEIEKKLEEILSDNQ